MFTIYSVHVHNSTQLHMAVDHDNVCLVFDFISIPILVHVSWTLNVFNKSFFSITRPLLDINTTIVSPGVFYFTWRFQVSCFFKQLTCLLSQVLVNENTLSLEIKLHPLRREDDRTLVPSIALINTAPGKYMYGRCQADIATCTCVHDCVIEMLILLIHNADSYAPNHMFELY